MTQKTLILYVRVRNRCWDRNRAHTSFPTESPDISRQVQPSYNSIFFGKIQHNALACVAHRIWRRSKSFDVHIFRYSVTQQHQS